MLLTNLLVLVAIGRDNVWLLLPWMVLHCVVIAFLALGAAILTAHDRLAQKFFAQIKCKMFSLRRPLLGSGCLLGVVLFLLCWKALRQLFMRMVDRQLQQNGEDFGAGVEGTSGIEEEEETADQRVRHELIFFGSKERKFLHQHHQNQQGQEAANNGARSVAFTRASYHSYRS